MPMGRLANSYFGRFWGKPLLQGGGSLLEKQSSLMRIGSLDFFLISCLIVACFGVGFLRFSVYQCESTDFPLCKAYILMM